MHIKEKGKVFAISGSSGAGKTTLTNKVLETLPYFRRVKTYTTRPIRPTEHPGLDYHFITVAEFETKIKNGFFIEYSLAYGHYYGSPKDPIKEIDFGLSLIYILDIQGCLALKEYHPEAIIIWIDSDLDILEERLNKRGEKQNTLKKRLDIARLESEQSKKVNIFDIFLKNIDLNEATFELKNYLKRAS